MCYTTDIGESMEKIKTHRGLQIIISLSVLFGIPATMMGSVALENLMTNRIRSVEREKYKEVLPYLLETDNGIPLKAKIDSKPITVNIDMTEAERKQAIKAINDLDKISNVINYEILDNNNSSVYADINLSIAPNMVEATHAIGRASLNYDTKTGYIKYPISIVIDDGVINYRSTKGVNLVDYVVKHEMMHTLGFKDMNDEQYYNKTVMWYAVQDGMELDDFSDLDIKNIKTMYDQNLITVTKPKQVSFVCNIKNKKDEYIM